MYQRGDLFGWAKRRTNHPLVAARTIPAVTAPELVASGVLVGARPLTCRNAAPE
jgi:hypothetical protein